MEDFRRRTAGSGGESTERSLDPALLERLAGLGYISGTAVAPLSGSGIDPKDKVAVANDLHDAIVLVENGEVAAALPLLERVTESDPQIPMAQLQLGVARCRLRQHARAIPALRKAITMQPDAMNAHYEMGLALFETGDLKTAAGHFEIVVQRMPKFADARFSLGSVYARIDRVPEALRELRAALDLEPHHYRANLLTGRILDLQGKSGEALPFLEGAVEANAASAEARTFLADAYERLGRTADAARERAKAAALRRPTS
jgi:tetratricopeptide (TPR) repeat protein